MEQVSTQSTVQNQAQLSPVQINQNPASLQEVLIIVGPRFLELLLSQCYYDKS